MANIAYICKAEVQYILLLRSTVSAVLTRSSVAYNLACADISGKLIK